jgi:hypothetical protein
MMREVTETPILDALRQLEPHLRGEVLDFIVFLTHRVPLQRAPTHTQPLTAADMFQSEFVGLWADRSDLDDSVTFARQLRHQTEHRRGKADDLR